MRPLEFRAWDADYKLMLDGDALEESGEDMPYGEEDGYVRRYFTGLSYGKLFVGYYKQNHDWAECDLMQFTGLHDKNGKPIFEGDIIVSDDYPFHSDGLRNYVGEVFWNEEDLYWSYDVHVVSDRVRGCACGGMLSDLDNWEIIGNIYENSELLNANAP